MVVLWCECERYAGQRRVQQGVGPAVPEDSVWSTSQVSILNKCHILSTTEGNANVIAMQLQCLQKTRG